MPRKSDFNTAIGRRKSAIARARVNVKKGEGLQMTVNDKDYREYFNYFEWQDIVLSPLKLAGASQAEVQIKVQGGGIKSQAEAIRLAIARALIGNDLELRPSMKKAGFLKRDARVKERKKPGLKKARRAPQWSKR